MKRGVDYIGVGVGAMVFNAEGRVLLAQRGEAAGNERGKWEFPGGKVEYGDRLIETVKREFAEEFGIEIEVYALLAVDDHILPDEGQHWVSPTYLARHVAGVAEIREPHKCAALGWFEWDDLPEPLSVITEMNVASYREWLRREAGD